MNAIRILFFGRLRDLAGAGELAIPAPVASLSTLRLALAELNPELGVALAEPSIRVAVDRSFVNENDADLSGASEIAFMPPMSGG